MNYVIENATIGWLIVGATAVVIAVAMIRSFQTRDVFRLGFEVSGSFWLSLTLGFALETPKGFKAFDLRAPVWKIMSLGRKSSKIEDYNNLRESTFHDLHHSVRMIRLPDRPQIPDHGNTMRLAACLSALFVGLIGGTFFSPIMKANRQKTERSTEAFEQLT